ncbi:MAG: hypothetical protein ACT4P0_09195 [Panacagrimonas sp.]
MHYRLVNVPPAASATVPPPSAHLSVDGIAPVPGEYATTVLELPASQTLDGRPLVRGYYAVLWPMDETVPRYDECPLYFGPFVSRQVAGQLVDEIVASGSVRIPEYQQAPARPERTQPRKSRHPPGADAASRDGLLRMQQQSG